MTNTAQVIRNRQLHVSDKRTFELVHPLRTTLVLCLQEVPLSFHGYKQYCNKTDIELQGLFFFQILGAFFWQFLILQVMKVYNLTLDSSQRWTNTKISTSLMLLWSGDLNSYQNKFNLVIANKRISLAEKKMTSSFSTAS